MNMEIIEIDRQYYISMSDIRDELKLSEEGFKSETEQYSWRCKPFEKKGRFISCKSACHFLSWYIDHSYNILPTVSDFKYALSKHAKKIPKRVFSRSLRIEIAYVQKYACNICKLFPIPPSFEVDHVLALEDGGQDISSNLQALCVPCHKEKTRLNRLRKNKIFEAQAAREYDQLLRKNKKQKNGTIGTSNHKKGDRKQDDSPQQNTFSKYFSKS